MDDGRDFFLSNRVCRYRASGSPGRPALEYEYVLLDFRGHGRIAPPDQNLHRLIDGHIGSQAKVKIEAVLARMTITSVNCVRKKLRAAPWIGNKCRRGADRRPPLERTADAGPAKLRVPATASSSTGNKSLNSRQ